MRKYKEKFLWKKFFYSNFMIFIIAILIFLISRGIYGLYKKYEFTKSDYDYVKEEQVDAENKLDMVERKFNNINTEEGKEKYIRETYSVKKEGEGVIFLYDSPSSTYEIPKGKSNWDSFIDFLKKIVDF